MFRQGLHLPKNAYLQNGCFWAKQSILFRREKIFWHPYIRNPARHLIPPFFGRAWDHRSKKGQCLTRNDQTGQFWANKLFLGGREQFWYRHIKEPIRHNSFLLKYRPALPQWATRDENGQFWPQDFNILGQKSYFFNRDFCHHFITSTPGATTFPLDPPQKNCVSKERVVFWGSAPFLKSSASGRMCLYFWFKINETCVIDQFPKNKKVIEDHWVLAKIDRVTADFLGIKLPKIAE